MRAEENEGHLYWCQRCVCLQFLVPSLIQIDLHDTLDRRRESLEPILTSLVGEPQAVDLAVENAQLGYKFKIHLQVRKCTSSPRCRWKRLTREKGIYITCDIIDDHRYVIVPSTLPSPEDFDKFGRNILSIANGSHSGRLTQHLDNILLKYCEGSRPLRLVSIFQRSVIVPS